MRHFILTTNINIINGNHILSNTISNTVNITYHYNENENTLHG